MNNNKKIIIIVLVFVVLTALLFFRNKTPDPLLNTATAVSVNEVKSYTLDEVAKHNQPTDCWLVINSKVINPTQFIAEGKHPNDSILKGCGKDATLMFENIPKHQGPRPQEALKQYEIGVLK